MSTPRVDALTEAEKLVDGGKDWPIYELARQLEDEAIKWQQAATTSADALIAQRKEFEAKVGDLERQLSEIRTLLTDAASVLDYWKGNMQSITSDRVKNELLPAIRTKLREETGSLG